MGWGVLNGHVSTSKYPGPLRPRDIPRNSATAEPKKRSAVGEMRFLHPCFVSFTAPKEMELKGSPFGTLTNESTNIKKKEKKKKKKKTPGRLIKSLGPKPKGCGPCDVDL